MTTTLRHPNALRQAGLSLVEMMIAMTLSLATIAAIGWVYLGTSQTYRSQDAIARLQEGARYAFEIISKDLRMAGAAGCSYSTVNNVVTNYPNTWFANLFEAPLTSVEFNGTAGTITQFSDALRVVRADVSREFIVQTHAPPTFTATNVSGVQNGTVMLATDCNHAAVFRASAGSSTSVEHDISGGNSTSDLGATYIANSRLYPISASTYYVAINPAGQPALYRQTPSGAEELVEGVEDIQVSFGVDTSAIPDGLIDFLDPDGDGDPYLTGAQVAAAGILGGTPQERWTRVVSVRISLLMRTVENNVLPSPQTYTFNGADVTATDRRLRKVFTHVVKMRNR